MARNVVFLHPDLGIGGAERAMIDAALALKSKNHSVQFVTSHHDRTHCFSETNDGTLKVTTAGDWLPRSIFGKCYALCAYLRMIYAAIYLVIFSPIVFDVIICDQISAAIPILKLSKAKILFYCHFPDMLLTHRDTFWKKAYRWLIDSLEEKTTGMADCVLVNSKYTAKVFKNTFTSLSHVNPEVLYPIPNFAALDRGSENIHPHYLPPKGSLTFLSINRYERKKNVELAIKAMGKLKDRLSKEQDLYLIVAGGYDDRVLENVEYYKELEQLAEEMKLRDNVIFLRSFSDAEKKTLLSCCEALLYTPDNEHFGIVPIESMYMRCPVIAVHSGGPLETVDNGKTGFLCEPNPESFAAAMNQFLREPSLRYKMGTAGRRRIKEKFSFRTFSTQLNNVVVTLTAH